MHTVKIRPTYVDPTPSSQRQERSHSSLLISSIPLSHCSKIKHTRTRNQGKKKTHKHKQIDCPGTGWVANCCLCVLWGGHSLWGGRGGEHINKTPRKSRDNPVRYQNPIFAKLQQASLLYLQAQSLEPKWPKRESR